MVLRGGSTARALWALVARGVLRDGTPVAVASLRSAL
jgi:hypothetical protein